MKKLQEISEVSETPERLYCSLDLETSGFDPLKNEILEVGFVIFCIRNHHLEVVEEFTQVFKPKGEVPAAIFGLTGITPEELAAAPSFEKYKEVLQEKLGSAVIVGHNVIFDIKFLEHAGIVFTGTVVDTLDLVQFMLPTHHSYNLENLMHILQVDHKNAHRALADSKAAIELLKRMIALYRSFPAALQDKVLKLSREFSFPWYDLLSVELPSQPLLAQAAEREPAVAFSLSLAKEILLKFPVGKPCLYDLVRSLQSQRQKTLVVVPKASQVMQLWKQGEAGAVFSSEYILDEQKLGLLEESPELTTEQAKFLLKLLVWRYTNWQHECVLDLNLSFFGGQFKTWVTGKELHEEKESKVLCCDFETFAALSEQGMYKSRFVVFAGLSEFEQFIAGRMGVKISWSYVLYILKSFYNPEFGTGSEQYREVVISALTATDLFFGLSNALLRQNGSGFEYYTVSGDAEMSVNFQKVKAASEHYRQELAKINETLGSAELGRIMENIRSFFTADANTVRWVELAETRTVFFSNPIDIAPLVQDALKQYKKHAFADSLGSLQLMAYFKARLGLMQYREVSVSNSSGIVTVQGDLFGGLNTKSARAAHVSCHLRPQILDPKDVVGLIDENSLPAAVLFGSQLQVKGFYDENYQELQKQAFLLVQNSSGGGNKLFHNFSIHKNSLLLATDKFILKQIQSATGTEQVERLPVKTLLLCHLPFEQYTHPYQQAVSSRFQEPFTEFSLPKAVYNFHLLLQFFNTQMLEKLYVCDAKLAKDYARAFKDYLKLLPDVDFLEV